MKLRGVGVGVFEVFLGGVRFRVLIYKVVCDGILIKSLGFQVFLIKKTHKSNL